MPKSRNTTENGFKLPSVDDLFNSSGTREEENNTASGIKDIPIAEIDDFPDHPFKIRNDEDMAQLAESIKEHGVITPATVRRKDDGRYEMISGHRRKFASSLLGIETLRCEVVDISRDEAVLQMVESNFHREKILPSEKGFAYKMRLDAMKRQGKRTDLTSSPLATKLQNNRSDVELGELVGESKDQIRRYIRLTYLIPELLELVDDERIKMRPAVELSYLTKEEQHAVFESIQAYDCTPSHAQTIIMRKKSENGELDADTVEDIMSEEKPNQKERITLNSERARKYIPKNVKVEETEAYIIKALEFYRRHLEKQAEHNREER